MTVTSDGRRVPRPSRPSSTGRATRTTVPSLSAAYAKKNWVAGTVGAATDVTIEIWIDGVKVATNKARRARRGRKAAWIVGSETRRPAISTPLTSKCTSSTRTATICPTTRSSTCSRTSTDGWVAARRRATRTSRWRTWPTSTRRLRPDAPTGLLRHQRYALPMPTSRTRHPIRTRTSWAPVAPSLLLQPVARQREAGSGRDGLSLVCRTWYARVSGIPSSRTTVTSTTWPTPTRGSVTRGRSIPSYFFNGFDGVLEVDGSCGSRRHSVSRPTAPRPGRSMATSVRSHRSGSPIGPVTPNLETGSQSTSSSPTTSPVPPRMPSTSSRSCA